MTWICPWCGKENYQDERIGRQEPRCTICNEERITATELEKLKEKSISNLERESRKFTDKMESVRERISCTVDQISELQSDLNDEKEELKDFQAELAPIECELSKWKEQKIFHEYNQSLRDFRADNDKGQAKLPFEVPA